MSTGLCANRKVEKGVGGTKRRRFGHEGSVGRKRNEVGKRKLQKSQHNYRHVISLTPSRLREIFQSACWKAVSCIPSPMLGLPVSFSLLLLSCTYVVVQ